MVTKARQGCRRNFLKQLAIMGWAGALAVFSSKAKADQLKADPESQTAADTSQGYRETAHIRKYYEKASF
jgi:hypothetical protein